MKKIIALLLVCFSLISCRQEIQETDLSKINGYWEIEKAELPDGTEKKYSINTTIDFFEIKGTKGFRKKVMPQLDGKYLINDLSEKISITNKDGDFTLNYTTSYAKWDEELLELSNDHMILRNDQDIEYTYKRSQPFSVK
ncbi:hypothetical protein ABGT15_07405 [Flavobacterium enshiense]|uniref:hypothetical protein n=1 Tax=Flavobacterium enshiense TaxID=1341165 RepID=UPI00345D937C